MAPPLLGRVVAPLQALVSIDGREDVPVAVGDTVAVCGIGRPRTKSASESTYAGLAA